MNARAFDVAVYGATAGGVLAAVAAARLGVQTLLVEPGRHVGGMVSGGLGRTDMDRQQHVIGGLAREFFVQVGGHYGAAIVWHFEPSVAQAVLERWLEEAKVEVVLQAGRGSVEMHDGTIVELDTRDCGRFAAEVWIDSSYEGDLMAGAGVSHVQGRDGRTRYGESLAGRQEILPNAHQFRKAVDARRADGRLLPSVQPYGDLGLLGEGDGRLQSYCFRLCLTRDAMRGLPIDPPAGYASERYELLARYLHALGEEATIRDFLGIAELPNDKVDVNSGGPVSTNLLGASWRYPQADAEGRAAIIGQHLAWAQGLLHFLASDRQVPHSLRRQVAAYRLPRDEFVTSDHWPPQLYVREARRMLGEHVLTQHDLERQRTKYDSIGMGGYNIDIREVQWVAAPISRFPEIHDEVLVEGYLSVPVQPYEIPYRSLLPLEAECANLLVSGCISASHVAYASYRMEPQFMIAGHSAGVAAALAVRSGVGVHRVELARLQSELERQGQVLRR
ncbi:MAG: FAD-dependent oxidoreductase [Chloroflexota bacterium]|nr:FAD-dependent oxidoreductase [Chloroflexota bacterium]